VSKFPTNTQDPPSDAPVSSETSDAKEVEVEVEAAPSSGTDETPIKPIKSIADEPTEVAEVTADGVQTTPHPSEPETDRFSGRVLANRYKITRRLGTGGFGAVFAAEDTKIRKQVAVKVLTRDLVTDSAILTRFRKEAEAASKVGHENIVDITDFDRTVDGHYFMVMEYLEGVDLGGIIRSGEQLSVSRVLGIMIQVCRALYATHSKGVVHRDLKPGNVFLIARGSRPDFVKLLDFGISKITEMDDESARLTRTGQIIGTPLYMAPEQACGEENVDHRADIYSLGVIMYELVTGKPPFTAVNYLGIIAQHASDPPVPPSKQRPDLEIPTLVENIILKAMAKRPADRFSTMVEMEGALIQALATIDPATAVTFSPDRTPASLLTPPTGLGTVHQPPSRRTRLWVLLGLAVLVGVGVAVFAAWPGKTRRPLDNIKPPVTLPVAPDARARAAREPDGPAPLPARKTVTIRLTSKPAGATVYDVSGKKLGKTPLEREVDRSSETLVWTLKRRGYKNTTIEVVPDGDKAPSTVVLKRRRSGGLPDDPKGWGQR
jgi:serine/threonine-protein kinase